MVGMSVKNNLRLTSGNLQLMGVVDLLCCDEEGKGLAKSNREGGGERPGKARGGGGGGRGVGGNVKVVTGRTTRMFDRSLSGVKEGRRRAGHFQPHTGKFYSGGGCHNTNSCSRTVFQEAGGTIRVPSTLSHIIEHTWS